MASPIRRFRYFSLCKKVNQGRLILRSNQTSAVQSLREQDEEVLYPPIKPKLPPGYWGDMEKKMAWWWHEEGEKWKNMPTIKERLDYLATKDSEFGSRLWKYPSFQGRPGLSEYQQDKTKTAIIEGAPEIVKNIEIDIENEFNGIKNILLDKLVEEYELISNQTLFAKCIDTEREEHLNTKLIQSLVMEMATALSMKYSHLLNGQMDHGVDIAAYWDRYGVRAFKPKPTEEKKKWKLPPRFLQNYSAYQSESHISCQLRSDNPLPEFLDRDDCTSQPYPECRFWPAVMGTSHDWVKPKCDPGFNPGDPYQYVNLSFIPRQKRNNKLLSNTLGKENLEDLIKYHGVNTAFISTVAQAYLLGFSTFVEMTYPLTTQTVMTDGRLFSIYSYQLNTLHLWKDDKGNPLRNICYIQENLPMFDTIENGQVKGFNDDTFKALMRCFALEPVNRGYDMKPAIPSDSPDLVIPEEYVPKPVEEVIVKEEIVYDLS